jgi:hypothetical protein
VISLVLRAARVRAKCPAARGSLRSWATHWNIVRWRRRIRAAEDPRNARFAVGAKTAPPPPPEHHSTLDDGAACADNRIDIIEVTL